MNEGADDKGGKCALRNREGQGMDMNMSSFWTKRKGNAQRVLS
jgi:hypothetical protein